MPGPVNEVGGGEGVEAGLQQVVLVDDVLLAQFSLLRVEGGLAYWRVIGGDAAGGIDPVLVVEDADLGVGVVALGGEIRGGLRVKWGCGAGDTERDEEGQSVGAKHDWILSFEVKDDSVLSLRKSYLRARRCLRWTDSEKSVCRY